MPLDLARIKAICLDVDGTLRDTDNQYSARVADILRPIRWLLPNRDTSPLARWLVMRFENPVNSFFGQADRFGLDGAAHWLVEHIGPWLGRHQEKPFLVVPDVVPAVKRLAESFPLAVVTARGAGGTLHFLEYAELSEHFQCVASALTSPRSKPSPDPILWAADQMGVQPEECLMVGDTTVDMIAGKAAGTQLIGVLSGFGEEEELRQAGAQLILPSVAEVPAVLGLA